jgi:hypothetical protein
MLHHKLLEKQEQVKLKSSRMRNNKNKGWNQWNRDQKDCRKTMKQKACSLKR